MTSTDLSPSDALIAEDTTHILDRLEPVFNELKGARLFLTGGTGFIGRWLLQVIKTANAERGADISVTVLTRDLAAFSAKFPAFFYGKGLQFLTGDVTHEQKPLGEFSHLIHAATEASAELNANMPNKMFETAVWGTQNMLDFATRAGVERVLFLSSGAVYGQQPWELTHVPETWTGAPDCTNPVNTYAEAKRAAEMLCAIYGKQFQQQITTARIFGLLGPFLRLDIHFAVGNFIRDALAGRKIVVKGNGRPYRSMLYTSDLVVWLFTLLVRGRAGTSYNVGSEQGISIADLAELVATTLGNAGFEILGAADAGWNLGRYVPDTKLITSELNLSREVSLQDAIQRTAQFNGWTAA